MAGRGGTGWLEGIDTRGLRSSVAGRVQGFDPREVMDEVELRRVPRLVPLALAASREAMAMARVELDAGDVAGQRRIGVALGTGGGGLAFVEEQYRAFFLEDKGSLF